jgi:hypothetical protein
MITDDQARDALILHLERSVKENRMLLRDQFAMAALTGMLAYHGGASSKLVDNDGWTAFSVLAYEHADSMLEARK